MVIYQGLEGGSWPHIPVPFFMRILHPTFHITILYAIPNFGESHFQGAVKSQPLTIFLVKSQDYPSRPWHIGKINGYM